MCNGGAPASARLLFADANSSFSAAESSPKEDPAAEFELGVGWVLVVLLRTSLRTLFREGTADGLVSAAQGPAITANIANESARALSIFIGGASWYGGCRESSAFHLSR